MPIKERPPLSVERSQPLAEAAYEEMRGLIVGGEWAARTRLPSEIELARRFGMSRPVIRQALARLREDGLIHSRQGSGSFVLGPAADIEPEPQVQFPLIGCLADLEAFLIFREGVEGEAAAMAARWRSDADLKTLAATAHCLAEEPVTAQCPIRDFSFHLAVAKASGNVFYVNTLSALREHILLGLGLNWSFASGATAFRTTVITHHATIIGAIERGDADSARAAMRTHLRWSRARLMTGDEAPTDL